MKIGIIGQGYVGNAVFQKFKNYFDVLTYDAISSKCNSTKSELLNKANVIFLCLPTPMNKNGSCDFSIIDNICSEINSQNKNYIIVIKSTVPPGTTQQLNEKNKNLSIIFNPEFLTERNAVDDFNNQNRIILGGPRPSTTEIKRVFSIVFPNATIIKTDSKYAEMVKYITNAFLATKVSFSNEMYELCKKLEIDYDKVIEYSKQDVRLGNSHWQVPGPDGDFGFGGHCLPKDLNALIFLLKAVVFHH